MYGHTKWYFSVGDDVACVIRNQIKMRKISKIGITWITFDDGSRAKIQDHEIEGGGKCYRSTQHWEQEQRQIEWKDLIQAMSRRSQWDGEYLDAKITPLEKIQEARKLLGI